MKIEVCLYAFLSSRLPEGTEGNCFEMEIDESQSIGAILRGLNIGPDEPKLILVNGVHSKQEAYLKEGDHMAVFPPILGG